MTTTSETTRRCHQCSECNETMCRACAGDGGDHSCIVGREHPTCPTPSRHMPGRPEATCGNCDVDFLKLKADAPAVKFDDGKPRWDLLPFDALDEVAYVLAYGANKYAPRNWEKGMSWGRLLAALLRHLSQWALGREFDAESGMHHLAHASCCVLMLYALVLRKTGTDDRYTKGAVMREETAASEAAKRKR